jgi:hypothetical protein
MLKTRHQVIGFTSAGLFMGIFFIGLFFQKYIQQHPYLGVIFPGSMLMMLFSLGYALGGKIKSGFIAIGFALGIGVIVFGLSKLGINSPNVFTILFIGAMFWYFKIGKKKRQEPKNNQPTA